MSDSTNVYVFISDDRRTFGLSVDADGRNLPLVGYGPWAIHDVIPMAANFIARYSASTAVAHTNLIMRGYHLVRAYGTTAPFPQRNPPRS